MAPPISKEVVRPDDAAPHVRRPRVVEAEPLFRLPEVSPDHVLEIFDFDFHARVKRIEVVAGDEPRGHVPFVFARQFIVPLDVSRRPVFLTERARVKLRIFIVHLRIRIEAQRLMVAHGPGDFLVHIGFDKLRAVVAVIGTDMSRHGDVVQQAGQHDLFRQAILLCETGAL